MCFHLWSIMCLLHLFCSGAGRSTLIAGISLNRDVVPSLSVLQDLISLGPWLSCSPFVLDDLEGVLVGVS